MNIINGSARVCGVFGNPIEHSISPTIHNYLAERTGQNLVYVPFRIENGYLGDAVKGAYAFNSLGINVTVPYKSEVMEFLKDIDELAERIGAVNTLVRVEGGFKGYNTDMPGLYRALCADGVKIEGEKVMILGAGGVARAVAMLLVEKKAKEIIVLNRTVEKAQAIVDELSVMTDSCLIKALPIDAYNTLPVEDKYLAIQATNVGMHPKVGEAVIMQADFYKRVHTGYDLVCNPLYTKFMELVEVNGGKAYNGLKMLLYQGIIAYELWTGCDIGEELAGDVYEVMLSEMKVRGK